MKKNRIVAFILAGVMMVSLGGSALADNTVTLGGTVANSTEAYQLVIPSGKTDLDLTNTASAQSIGDLKVTRTSADKTANLPFSTNKRVTVTVSSANNGKLKKTDGTDTLTYALGIDSASVTDWTIAPTQAFYAVGIDSETAVPMTAFVTGDAAKVANGTYQDVLTFTAASVTLAALFEGGTGMTWAELIDYEYDISDSAVKKDAFKDCGILASITIPTGVTSIGASAFCGCTGLTGITIPASVATIGSEVFNGCSELTAIHYNGTKAQWNNIDKSGWKQNNSSIVKVICSDGEITSFD